MKAGTRVRTVGAHLFHTEEGVVGRWSKTCTKLDGYLPVKFSNGDRMLIPVEQLEVIA